MRTIIVGIGNPLMGDDGVGVKVARMIGNETNIEFIEMNTAGMDVVENILGYDCAVIIDGVFDERKDEGDVVEYLLEEFEERVHMASIHEMNFPTALKIGKLHYPEKIPEKILIFGIVIKDIQEFHDTLSENIERKLKDICKKIMHSMEVEGCLKMRK